MRDVNGNRSNVNEINGSVNIQGDFSGNIIYGTQVNNDSHTQEKIQYCLKRGSLAMNSKLISTIGIGSFLAGFLGFVSSIITIVQGFKFEKLLAISGNIEVFSFMFAIGMIVMFFIKELKQKRIVSVFQNYIFGFHIGLFNDGNAGILKLTSRCPKEKCGGKLHFSYSEKDNMYYFVCSRNPGQHRFEFDFTELDF